MIDYDDYLKLARDLSTQKSRGAPKQVYLRRAISTAYYGVFHCLCDWATCRIVGSDHAHNTLRFRLVYRSFQHGEMRSACEQARNGSLPEFGLNKLCNELRTCADIFVELQKWRHDADYNPHAKIALSDAQNAVARAQAAVINLRAAPEDQKELFLFSLRFKTRK